MCEGLRLYINYFIVYHLAAMFIRTACVFVSISYLFKLVPSNLFSYAKQHVHVTKNLLRWSKHLLPLSQTSCSYVQNNLFMHFLSQYLVELVLNSCSHDPNNLISYVKQHVQMFQTTCSGTVCPNILFNLFQTTCPTCPNLLFTWSKELIHLC